MWNSSKVRASLFTELRKSFPDSDLPYTYKEMLEIGRCVEIPHLMGLWWLRLDLRELAYDIWRGIRDQGFVNKSTRRDLIEKGLIKSIDELRQSLQTLKKNGSFEAFAEAHSNDHYVDINRLFIDLKNLADSSC